MTSFFPGSNISGSPAFNPTSQPSYEHGGGTPGNIAGLQLWLDADDPNTIVETLDKVSQWTDKSGEGNDTDVQGTGTAQPTTNASTQNGRNVLDFDNTDTLELPSALYAIPNGSNTMFLVGSQTDSGVGDYFIGMTEAGGGRYYLRSDSTVGRMRFLSRTSDSSAIILDGVTLANFNIYTSFRDGTTLSLSNDGGTPVTNTAGASEAGVDAAFVGSKAGVGTFLTGGIAEILIYNRLLTAVEIASVEGYLGAKWGITLA